jgi:oxaloacetate decarboxylase alpha subunit
MSEMKLIDTTVRDGNQSLWGATGLNTAMILQIAPVMDQVGFQAVDFTASTHMGVAVRWYKESPWDRIRLAKAAMPNTQLSLMSSGMRFISWERAHDEIMRLSFKLLVDCGISRYQLLDPFNDMSSVAKVAQMVAEEGGEEIVAAFTYTISPIHDDDFYAEAARRIAASPHVTRTYVKDPGGMLTPERARVLFPILLDALGDKPLEFHSHCNIGLAPLTYMIAAELGIQTLHTAVAPLSNGTSQPSTEQTVSNLREMGHTVDIDDKALAEMSSYFSRLAEAEGLPRGITGEFDPLYFRHQMPGGMITTLRRHVMEAQWQGGEDALYEEIAKVREEFGYPVMVTPFSQLIAAQAAINLGASERYETSPDEVIRYFLGRFGLPPVPMDPDVKDRVLGQPRARDLEAEPPMPGVAELRKQFGRKMPDEEFLLRVVMPGEQVDAMLAAGPTRLGYDPAVTPVTKLLKELSDRPPMRHFVIEKPDFRLELSSSDA